MFRVLAVSAFAALLFSGAVGMYAQRPDSDDKKFLTKDSQGNVAEVELAKLALKRAYSVDVKAFAQRMVTDHEQLARNSKVLLDRAGLQPSTSLNAEHQRLFDKLNALSGVEFDKEYVKAMDRDHHEDLKDFRKEASTTKDPVIRGILQAGAAVIAEHTRMIDDLCAKMGMMPAGM